MNRDRWAAVAAVVAIIIGTTLYLRGSNVGPMSSVPSSASPAGTETSALPAPTSTPSQADFVWASLRWSDPFALPGCAIGDTIAWHGGLIAAAGCGPLNSPQGAIWHSLDETSWSQLDNDPSVFADSAIRSLAAGPSGLIALGWSGRPSAGGLGATSPVFLWSSTDGINWVRVADTTVFDGAGIQAITAGAQGYLAVGDTPSVEPKVWFSATGSTWQQVAISPDTFHGAQFTDVRATASGFVIVGDVFDKTAKPMSGVGVTPAAWWSPDGHSWSKASVEASSGQTTLDAVYLGAKGLVAVASASADHPAAAWTSTGGRSWQLLTATGSVGAVPISAQISDDGTHIVAVGAGTQFPLAMWVSSDGATWQQMPFSGATSTIPSLDSSATGFGWAFVVPDGLIVFGLAPTRPIWRLVALP